MIVAKLGSPLAIGLGNDEYFIANDVSPFIDYTNKVIYLEDLQIAILKRGEKSKLRSMQDDHITDYYIEKLAKERKLKNMAYVVNGMKRSNYSYGYGGAQEKKKWYHF